MSHYTFDPNDFCPHGSVRDVVFFASHPAPYRDPTFRLLAERGMSFEVVYFDEVDQGHPEWDWEEHAWKSLSGNPGERYSFFGFLIHLDIIKWFLNFKGNIVVVPGYSSLTSIIIIGIALAKRKKLILALDSTSENSKVLFIKTLKRILLNLCHAYWVPGKAGKSFLQAKGFGADKVFEGYYCIDSEYIYKKFSILRKERASLRENFYIDSGEKVFLCVGKMIPSRRYDLLLSVWQELVVDTPVHLILVGDGPDEERLKQMVSLKQKNKVSFLGACSFSDLPLYYAISDVFVHPGAEPFSTALEVAAVCELPLLTSKDVGYIQDYVALGGEPFLFNFQQSGGFVNSVYDILESLERAIEYSAGRGTTLKSRNPSWAADQVEQMLDYLRG